MNRVGNPAAAESAPPRLDARGRYRVRGRISFGVVGFYLFLLLLIGVFLRPPGTALWVGSLLAGLVLLFLARYLSTGYTLDEEYLRAWRILGGQKLQLKDVRRIEFTSLRELSPTGFWGSWGWRGRMWSPGVGSFDCIHSDPRGILVTAGDHPLFISPADPAVFAVELSRRVRSHGAQLMVDETAARARR